MSNDNSLSPAEATDRIWDVAKSNGIAMFVTWDGERQRARPLAAMPRREEHAIYFLTDVHGVKDDQAERFPIVTLTFADKASNTYVSITGHADVSNDRAKIRELWSVGAQAWWDSPEDPAIRLITVSPDDAELWDGPNRLVAGAKMLAAAVTGGRPDMGDNKKVQL